jgi:hypothetical protein
VSGFSPTHKSDSHLTTVLDGITYLLPESETIDRTSIASAL